jgi:hypothetical protein
LTARRGSQASGALPVTILDRGMRWRLDFIVGGTPVTDATPAASPVPPPQAKINPLRTRADWQRARDACQSDPGRYHGDIAARELHWFDPTAGNAWYRWFVDARTNACFNEVDRHVLTGHGAEAAPASRAIAGTSPSTVAGAARWSPTR